MRPRAWRGSCGRALWDISGKHGAGLAGRTGSTGFRWQASAVFANPGAPKAAGQLTWPRGQWLMAQWRTGAVALSSCIRGRADEQANGRPVAGRELCPGSDATADRPNQRDGGPAAPGAWPFRTEATRTPHSRFGEERWLVWWVGRPGRPGRPDRQSGSLVKVCVSRLGNSPRLRRRLRRTLTPRPRLSTTHHAEVALCCAPALAAPISQRQLDNTSSTAPARQHQLDSASSPAELHPPAALIDACAVARPLPILAAVQSAAPLPLLYR